MKKKYPVYPSAAYNYKTSSCKQCLEALKVKRSFNGSIMFKNDVLNGYINYLMVCDDIMAGISNHVIRHYYSSVGMNTLK